MKLRSNLKYPEEIWENIGKDGSMLLSTMRRWRTIQGQWYGKHNTRVENIQPSKS